VGLSILIEINKKAHMRGLFLFSFKSI